MVDQWEQHEKCLPQRFSFGDLVKLGLMPRKQKLKAVFICTQPFNHLMVLCLGLPR